MSALDLIGAVGAAALRSRIDVVTGDDGIARYMLDQLNGAQVAAIVNALLKDADIEQKCTIRIPRMLVNKDSVPDAVLTDERTVRLRHAAWPTRALLLANTEDDQGASLDNVTRIGAKHLTAESRLWVDVASAGLNLPEEQINVWRTALMGLITAEEWSLHQMARYVELTRSTMRDDGRPLLDALGWALPALKIPRDSGIFRAIRAKDQLSRAKWRKQFEKLVEDRAPLLEKQRRPGQIIEAEDLRLQWETVRNDVHPEAHAAVEAFIVASPGWSPEAASLAEREFESEGVAQLFSGLKQRKLGLAEATAEYFDMFSPDRLSEDEKQYLEQLKKVRDAGDEERDFFEKHREELAQDKALRAKWEKFVFGKPIECQDLLSGLLLAIERLYGQSANSAGPRTLVIRSNRQTKAQWLDLNADIGRAFSLRYRGLQALMGAGVVWETPHIFAYEDLLEQAARRRKYRRNESTARASLQIKFDVSLKVSQGASTEKNTVQLIWMGQPNAIGVELAGDLGRLEQRPLMLSEVSRQAVSRKGALQAISLADVTTLEPAYGKDSGSLIPRLAASADLGRMFPAALKKATMEGRIGDDGKREIEKAWKAFDECYAGAVRAWRTDGLASELLLRQADLYGELLSVVRKWAASDVARQELLEPILRVGCVAVTGAAPAALIPPWHPLRLMAIAAKARMVAGLIQHVLATEEVNFGDRRLFFADLRGEIEIPWYPEVCVGYSGTQPVLLAETGSLNDYSLMERPVSDVGEAVTDVDAREAGRQIRQLVGRYLELQPHETSNLSIMLYNCDAAGLPIEAVNALSALSDEGEVHCNVLVRHRDRSKLSRVYGELLERAEIESDAMAGSETSRNFMSKLRIGVMLDAGVGDGTRGRNVDVAFLHDVVARQARLEWFSAPKGAPVDILEHVPPRWSYRRVTAEDELKATSFLTCPRQPAAGWAYLDAVAAVIRQQAHASGEHLLPARQISFGDHHLKAMFDEVHSLAEWVATFDELLDKRQLRAHGVRVIRYRRQYTHGRNMVVSSTADMRILDVLVRRRLNELSLGLPDDRLTVLASKMINDALAISGDIVLRAAKRGVSAGELIGLVLSRALLNEELQGAGTIAWFLLDDYAEWLGQREEGIADILGLAVERLAEGKFRLRIAASEAKYVGADGAAEARRTSARQLRETVVRMENALFGDPGRLDRDLWLSRIADLLLDGTTEIGQTAVLESVRDAIRQGKVEIDLRGYSHVFVVHPPDGGGVVSEQEHIAELACGLQEVFARQEVRALLLAYEAGNALQPVRAKLGDDRPWTKSAFRVPADRVSWTVRPLPQSGDVEPQSAPQSKTTDAPQEISKPADVVVLQSQEPRPEPITTLPESTAEDVAPALVGSSFMSLVTAKASQQQALSVTDEEWLAATTQKLRSALISYNLQAKVLGSRLTPNAALVRFMGSDRLRVEDIEAKRSGLLTTHGMRIVGIAPLPGEIVVSVGRPARQTVSLWDLWARRELNINAAGVNSSFVLGLKELDGEILYLNLGSAFGGEPSHDPHTLIAGATGSGKSVLIQAIILDIAATNLVGSAEIRLIDPKMGVDYAPLERLPHILGGIVTDQNAAVTMLEQLAIEMDRRYELFRAAGARDLKTFNQKVPVGDRLPMIFVIHDEFAEWMLTDTYRDQVTATVQRLGVKARAAGIHLFFAAQRPDAGVMPMQLRDNLGNRLVLKVSSVGTSEIALNTKGAENLLGNGHLAAKLGGNIIFAQAPFLSDEDIDRAVDAIIADNVRR